MRVPILMPQLGESIAEAVVIEIDVEPDTMVEPDAEIMQVETNKAVMGVTTPCRGRIAEITASLDQSYAVGATLGFLEVSQEDAEKAGLTPIGDEGAASAEGPAQETSPSAREVDSDSASPANLHFRVSAEAADAFQGEEPGVQPTVTGLPVPASATGAAYLSPRMKARMQELGLNAADLAGVAGSGAGGRVTIDDFEKFIGDLEEKRTTAASPMRIAVADSMRRSWTRPLATVGRPVQLDAVLRHRRASDPKPGIALYAIRALAMALAENTAVAGRLVGEQIVHPDAIDIGFAVEVEDGVLVPVIRDVDGQSLTDLVASYDSLVRQARDRRLPPEATGAGAATVTNFGTFGIVWATPIPLPEQNLVLGLGAGRKAPVWDAESESFQPITEAEMTLSFDHRVLDGGAAGRLLQRVSDLFQTPEAL